MGHRSTDAVPVCSLVGKHALMGIQDEINDIIRCRALETVAEPIDCHLSGCHRIEHEILQFEQGDLFRVERGERVFVHAPIISMGFGRMLGSVCHLANWLPRPTSLYHLAGKWLHTASQSNCSNSPTFCSGSCDSTMLMISSINCSLAMSISRRSIVINLQTFDRKVLENHALILHGVLDTNARDLPCVW